jgi:hypothetical protein
MKNYYDVTCGGKVILVHAFFRHQKTPSIKVSAIEVLTRLMQKTSFGAGADAP